MIESKTLQIFYLFLQQLTLILPRKKERNGKMKSTGIVRKVDELGRIVLDIAEKDSLEIYMDGASIILKKYQPSCIFCDDAKDVIVFRGKNICPKCIKALQESGHF